MDIRLRSKVDLMLPEKFEMYFMCVAGSNQKRVTKWVESMKQFDFINFQQTDNIFNSSLIRMESPENDSKVEHLEGRWQTQQHHQFLRAIMVYGKDWKTVEKQVNSRAGPQVRSHAQKFFIKLNKFNKQRRKGKNSDLLQPQQIQQEIIDLFSAEDITPNTPKQIVTLLNCNWEEVQEHFDEKKRQSIQRKISRKQGTKRTAEQINEGSKDELKQCNQEVRELNESNEESYFIRIIKSNQEHFRNGKDFSNLFDFGHNHYEETQVNHNRLQIQRRQRSQSFSLPEESNPGRLKQTLEQFHRAMGFDN